MNRLKFLSFFAFVFLVLSESEGVTVIIDPSVKYQRFEGWGSSLCWWANNTGRWSAANRARLVGAIVNPDTGLGYNIFRYNIGGGDRPGHNHLTKGNGGAAIPGFKPTENGPYDWSADSCQRNILLEIAAQGKDLIFEAFSNSPPWWMTKSGCAAGSSDGSDNLKSDYFDDFADYLTEVVKHYKETYNILFRTVEPFNEPSAGWWNSNGTQEGCGFKNNQSLMIVELGKALAAKNLFPATTVSASDETSIEQALKTLNAYSQSALDYISQINTHSYSGYNFRTQLAQAAASKGKRLWQSETGPLHKDDNSNIALWMADVIIRDLREMKAEAWLDWQICDPSGNWMTINADLTNQRFTYTSRFYMHSAFSRFIRPGSQIIASNNDNTVAALVPSTGSLVVVIRNGTGSSVDYTFDLSKFSELGETVKIHRFSLPGSLTSLPDIPVSGKSFSISVPGQTVTTCVIPGVIPAECDPPVLTPYAKVNNDPWQETDEVTVDEGDSLILGPQPLTGDWTWSGPQNFSSNSREVKFENIRPGQAGNYKALYTNSYGCTSSVIIKVNIIPVVSLVNQFQKFTFRPVGVKGSIITVNGSENRPIFLELYNLRGSVIYRKKVLKPSSIPVSSIAGRGSYIVKAMGNSGEVLYISRINGI
jgi:O-glycosyl hydrolase